MRESEGTATLNREVYIRSAGSGAGLWDLSRGLAAILSALLLAFGLVLCFQGRAGASFGGEDGRIAFERLDSGVYTLGAEEERARKLAGGFDPAFYPGGERVAYSTGSYLYAAGSDGLAHEEVSGRDHHASWSDTAVAGDGTLFAGAKVSESSPLGAIFRVSAAGGRQAVSPASVPGCENLSAYNPAVSPANGDLAFEGSCFRLDAYGKRESNGALDVYANGVSLTDDSTANDYSPSYSPDGARIAFISERDGNAEVYVMDADGSNQIRLTNTPENEDDPVFSPSGESIAFIRELDAPDSDGTVGQHPRMVHVREGGDLFVMDADGANARNLTNSRASENDPDWGVETDRTPGEYADLRVSHRAPEREPKVGERFVYSVVVENPGNVDAPGAEVNVRLPGNVALLSAPGCEESAAEPGTLRCVLGEVAADAEVALEVAVRARTEGRAEHRASVTGELSESDLTNNESVLRSYNVEATPPRITRTDPTSRSGRAAPAARITAFLSEPVFSPPPGTVTLVRRDTGRAVPVSIQRLHGPERLVVLPKKRLLPGKTYTVSVRGGEGGLTDLRGNPMEHTKTWSFTVRR